MVTQFTKYMKLTHDIIGSAIAEQGQFSAKQLAKLGIQWPPKAGWINSLIGLTIPDQEWNEVLSMENAYKTRLRRQSQLSLQTTLFNQQEKTSPISIKHKIEVYFDGGCHGNPGYKYGSYETYLDGKKVGEKNRVDFGLGTSNEAEWDSLLLALGRLKSELETTQVTPSQCELLIFTDSTMVKNRLLGKNKISKKYPRSAVMFELANKCLEVMRQFGRFNVVWERRDSNVARFGH